MAITEIHLTADTDVWTGASTTAQLSALAADSAVVISAGSDEVLNRLRRCGLEVVSCPMTGMLGALNLSRALRHVKGSEFEVYVHSLGFDAVVAGALKLVGRSEKMTLVASRPQPAFPPVEVIRPLANAEPLIMWLGNITQNSGLAELIEQLGTRTDKPWRLRVVGQGRARVVSPILKRARSLGIDSRIEWVGYSANPYEQMNGVSAAIVGNERSVVAREFEAASIPVFTNLSDIL